VETGRRHLILVRHGDYDTTIQFPANPDGHLNERGRKQAEAVADRLQGMKLDAIFSSSLIRARETTEVIAACNPHVPVHITGDLQECIPCVPKGLEKLFEGIPANFIKSGPSQAAHVFKTYFKPIAEDAPNRTEVIVSHGNLLGYLVSRVFDAPAETWLRADFGNCCISGVLVRYDGVIKLMYHNDGAHLSPELRS